MKLPSNLPYFCMNGSDSCVDDSDMDVVVLKALDRAFGTECGLYNLIERAEFLKEARRNVDLNIL